MDANQNAPTELTDEQLLRTYGAAKRDYCYEGDVDDWPKKAERAATVAGLRAVIAAGGARRAAPPPLLDLDALLSPAGAYETGPDAGNADGAQLVRDRRGNNPTWWAPVFGSNSLDDLLDRIRSRILPHLRPPVLGVDVPVPDAARATQLQEAWGDIAPADAVAGLAQLASILREETGQPSPPTSPTSPTSPAEGAAWQAAAALRRLAAQNPMGVADPAIISAAELLERLAGELATLRQQQAAPVPVSERLPDTSDPSECRMPDGDCWWFDPHQDGAWYMDTYQSCYTHWLPAHVLPLPWVKPPMADATADTAAALLQQQAAELDVLRQVARPVAIPGEAYDNDMGPVTWWRFPVEEEPWVGTPGDSDWPGYHTHFTPCPLVPAPPEDCPHD